MERERQVRELFITLADTLVKDYDVPDYLQRLVDGVADIFPVDVAGVLIERSHHRLALSAASSEDMRTLEAFELQDQTGPCYAAYRELRQVVADDLGNDDRWPEFSARAVEIGFRSVTAFPLRLREESIGALNLLSAEPGRLEDDDLHLGQALADVATIGLLQERTVSEAEVRGKQLQHALDSRVLIEQAKGMLAERLEISPGDAFERMRSHSRSTNTKLRDVCRRVVDEGFAPGQ